MGLLMVNNTDTTIDLSGLYYAVIGIAIVAVLLSLFWMVIRKRFKHHDALDDTGFTLADLERLHTQGQLSDEEFAAAKQKLIDQTRHAAAKAPETE